MRLSLVIPVFNEEAAIPLLFAELRPALDRLDCEYEMIFVDDGSADATGALLEREANADARVKILRFSRNFGHQTAVTAGLDFSSGDAVVMMDADLQDPPELLAELVRLYREGFDVVSPQRISRPGDSWWKRMTAAWFYALMRRLTDERVAPQVGDFRLLSRRAAIAFRSLREQHRFLRGMIAWMGFREAFVPFHRRERAGGETKYSLWKMLRLSWTAVTSFSALPLRLATLAGAFASLLSLAYFLYAAYVALIRHSVVQGWTSIVFLQCFFFGITLLSLGVLGQYVARIYDESKSRPLYVISAMQNLDSSAAPVDRVVVLTAREKASAKQS